MIAVKFFAEPWDKVRRFRYREMEEMLMLFGAYIGESDVSCASCHKAKTHDDKIRKLGPRATSKIQEVETLNRIGVNIILFRVGIRVYLGKFTVTSRLERSPKHRGIVV
jgi:hypothetical protein